MIDKLVALVPVALRVAQYMKKPPTSCATEAPLQKETHVAGADDPYRPSAWVRLLSLPIFPTAPAAHMHTRESWQLPWVPDVSLDKCSAAESRAATLFTNDGGADLSVDQRLKDARCSVKSAIMLPSCNVCACTLFLVISKAR
jgi:hypothetical protein